MQRAFVAGATGLTGRFVVEELVRRGVEVHAHVRSDSPRLAEWRARFEGLGASCDATPWVEGAIRARFAELRPALVFGCLGTTRSRVKQASREGRDPSRETYEAVDVALTEMCIRAAKESGATRFVYLSSVGAGGSGPENAYLAARTKVERALRESGVPFTIVRPSFIVGERDAARASEKVFGGIADAGLSFLGAIGAKGLRDRYRSITGEQLGRALVALALDPAQAGRVVEGAAPILAAL